MSTNEKSQKSQTKSQQQTKPSVTDVDHICIWTRNYANVTFELREKQKEVDRHRRREEAADAKKNQMQKNCVCKNILNLCMIDDNKPCEQQCGRKNAYLKGGQLKFK